MRYRSTLFAAALLIVAQQGVHGFQEPGPTDGIWHPVTAVLGGQEFPKPVLDSIVLKITGEQYAVTVNGTPDKGSCVVDTSNTPHRMTITGKVGPNQGKTLLAIFEVTGEGILRVCYDLTGKEFPTEFKAPAGTMHYLVEYRKELAAGAELSGRVLSVPDSDVIELQTEDKKTFRVRLNGIDAPEMNQLFGLKSKELLTSLVGEKTVRVVTQGEDRTGQIIGDVYFKGDKSVATDEDVHLNAHMVVNGLAWHFVRFAPDNKTLAESEKQAREKKAGLWSEADPVAPWDWRRQQAEKQKEQK
jgi:micrococcal nuclease